MPRGGQLVRQWQLLQMIERPAGVTVEDASAELHCSIRTVWRDLRVLEDAGFPLFDEKSADGRRTRWQVLPEFKASLPLRLTLAELAALLMSRELLAPIGVSLLGPAVQSAFDKIAGVLSRDALKIIDDMRGTLGVRALGAKLQLPVAEHLPKLHEALLNHRTVRVHYHSYSRGADTERAIDPYHLTYFNGGLYLVGYCHLREAIRIFAVERIRKVETTRERFTAPADFDAQKYLEGAWGILRGDLVTVRVRFAKTPARYVKERLWHPSQTFRDLDDGRLEITLRVADTQEVRRWILGYGVEAEVLEPASLLEALRSEARRLAETLVPRRPSLARVDSRGSQPSRVERVPRADST